MYKGIAFETTRFPEDTNDYGEESLLSSVSHNKKGKQKTTEVFLGKLPLSKGRKKLTICRRSLTSLK